MLRFLRPDRVFALALLAPIGCSPGGSVTPSLGAVLSRVDVPRLLACGEHLPDYKAAAVCLGAQALTQGLRLALDKAMGLAEQAQNAAGPAGAADTTPEDRAAIATELDEALADLAVEIDAAAQP